MKRFELWQYDRETDELEEINFRGIVNRFKSFFKKIGKFFRLSRIGYGRKKVVPVKLPTQLSEATKVTEGADIVEILSCYYLYHKFEADGFDVRALSKHVPHAVGNYLTSVKQLQGQIRAKATPAVMKTQIKENRKRDNIAKATAERLYESIIAEIMGDPDGDHIFDIYKVDIDWVGTADASSTKADFNVVVYKGTRDEKDQIILREISHKFDQIDKGKAHEGPPWPTLLRLLTGSGAAGRGVSDAEKKRIVSDLKRYKAISNPEKFTEAMDLVTLYASRKGMRTGEKSKYGDHGPGDPKLQKKYQDGQKMYFDAIAKLIKKKPDHLAALLGFGNPGETLETLIVVENRGKYKSLYARESKNYEKLKKNFFDKEIKSNLKVETDEPTILTNGSELDIRFKFKDNTLFETRIKFKENFQGDKTDIQAIKAGKPEKVLTKLGQPKAHWRGVGEDDLVGARKDYEVEDLPADDSVLDMMNKELTSGEVGAPAPEPKTFDSVRKPKAKKSRPKKVVPLAPTKDPRYDYERVKKYASTLEPLDRKVFTRDLQNKNPKIKTWDDLANTWKGL